MAGFTGIVRSTGGNALMITIPKIERIRHNVTKGDYIAVDFDKGTIEHIKQENKKGITNTNKRFDNPY